MRDRAETTIEQALRESEGRLQLALSVTDLGVYEWDLVNDRITANDRFKNMVGVGEPLLGARVLAGAVHPDDRAWVGADLAHAMDGGSLGRFVVEHRLAATDPFGERWVLSHGQVYFEESENNRQAVRVLGTLLDISERKRVQKQLRESEQRQAFLLKFSDALRAERHPDDIGELAIKLFAAEVNVDRCYITMSVPEEKAWVVPQQFHREHLFPFPAKFAEEDHPKSVELVANQNIFYENTADDARLTETDRASLGALGFGAMMVSALRQGEGNAIWAFITVSAEPRRWTISEKLLIVDVAERTWAAIERTRAEAALRESEERLRQFGEASQDVLWIRDAEKLQWEYLTPAFEAIYGLDRHTALSGNNMAKWVELILPEDRERAVGSIQRVRDGEWVTFEYRIRRPVDGQVRWLRNTDFPIKDGTGRVVRVGGVGHDITVMKEVEEALAAAEQRQRLLLEGIPQLVWRSNDDGSWTWSSPQWQAFTGQNQEASCGWGWLDAIHPDDREATMRAWHEARPHGLLDVEHRVRRADDGAWRWHATRSVPVRRTPGRGTPEGRILEWLGTTTDIEDQVRSREELERRVAERTGELMTAEAMLRQAQKMDAVGQLTGGIAHDFNNMLQAIGSSLDLVRRRADQGRMAEMARYIEAAHETVRRAAALTHRLLAFARQQTLAPALVHLGSLVEGMAEMIRRTMGPEVQVEVRLGDGAWPVLCDESQLENALLNLCVNARDAMPQGGWLTISTSDVELTAADLIDERKAGEEGLSPGAYAAVAVADTGSGMDAATQARVFEPFFTTKPLGQGTGLGLSQVYGFVRQSGGLVRLDSASGEGTTVRILLPRHEPGGAEQGDAAMAAVVLLVEDEENLRLMVAEWLRDAGYRVLEAPDGAAALRLLNGGSRVDALVTDVGLPGGINGRQVAEAARAQQADLPILLVTGYAGEALRGAPLPAGVAVLDKPFALDDLVERVHAMLEITRPHR